MRHTVLLPIAILLVHLPLAYGQTSEAIDERAILALPNLFPGDADRGVAHVQSFLRRFGYLEKTKTLDAGKVDDATAEAIAKYQLFLGVDTLDLGSLDEPTRLKMIEARCGNVTLIPHLVAKSRATWNRRNLTYSFGPVTNQVGTGLAQDALAEAFATWENGGVGLSFTRVTPQQNPDIMIEWRPAADPDHDMRGAIVAHASYPGSSPPLALHFDDEESTWRIGSYLDIESVALHEIGHNLGLEHTPFKYSVMYENYHGVVRELQGDDVLTLHRIYPNSSIAGVRRIRNLARTVEFGGDFLDIDGDTPILNARFFRGCEWEVSAIGNGRYQFRNRVTERYLDIDGRTGEIITNDDSGSGTIWRVDVSPRGATIQNQSDEFRNWYLDIDGRNGSLILNEELAEGAYWAFCLRP